MKRGRGCYVHNKCNHEECKQANAEYQRRYMNRWRVENGQYFKKPEPSTKFLRDDPMRDWL